MVQLATLVNPHQFSFSATRHEKVDEAWNLEANELTAWNFRSSQSPQMVHNNELTAWNSFVKPKMYVDKAEAWDTQNHQLETIILYALNHTTSSFVLVPERYNHEPL